MPQFVVTSDQLLAYALGAALFAVLFCVVGFLFDRVRKPFYGIAQCGFYNALAVGLFWIMAYLITSHQGV